MNERAKRSIPFWQVYYAKLHIKSCSIVVVQKSYKEHVWIYSLTTSIKGYLLSCCRVHQVDYAPFLSLTWQIVIWVKKSVTLMTSVWLYTPWCFLNFPGFFLIQINGRGKHFYVTKCNLGFPWPHQRPLCGFRMGKHLPPPLM